MISMLDKTSDGIRSVTESDVLAVVICNSSQMQDNVRQIAFGRNGFHPRELSAGETRQPPIAPSRTPRRNDLVVEIVVRIVQRRSRSLPMKMKLPGRALSM